MTKRCQNKLKPKLDLMLNCGYEYLNFCHKSIKKICFGNMYSLPGPKWQRRKNFWMIVIKLCF